MKDIIRLRLHNQQLTQISHDNAIDLMQWMGAVQAQDYAGAKWALGCRLKNGADEDLDTLVDKGQILRTHVLRPTWHFVLPEDIRWMLELTEPRITAFCLKYFKDFQLDKTVFKQSNRTIGKALQRGEHLTKKELGAALQKVGIATNDLRLTFIILRAELDQLVCNGARQGKQFTYALLESRAPKAKILKKDEALAALAKRYFTSRGPATLKDFTWWSGLAAGDARTAFELVQRDFDSDTIHGQLYLFSEPATTARKKSTHLLPAWDEYTVAYKDRSLVIDPAFVDKAGNGIFNYNIVSDGHVIGSWKRVIKKDKVMMDLNYFTTPSQAVTKAVLSAAKRYAKFVGKELEVASNRLRKHVDT